jgi:hypothetical protein
MRNNYKLLPIETIKAATMGDSAAMDAVTRHFGGYIAKLSMRPMVCEDGNVRYSVDEDMRDSSIALIVDSPCVIRENTRHSKMVTWQRMNPMCAVVFHEAGMKRVLPIISHSRYCLNW